MYLVMQYINFMFVDITKSEFTNKKNQNGRHFQNVCQNIHQIMKMPYFPYISIYLVMQYINFMHFDIKSRT